MNWVVPVPIKKKRFRARLVKVYLVFLTSHFPWLTMNFRFSQFSSNVISSGLLIWIGANWLHFSLFSLSWVDGWCSKNEQETETEIENKASKMIRTGSLGSETTSTNKVAVLLYTYCPSTPNGHYSKCRKWPVPSLHSPSEWSSPFDFLSHSRVSPPTCPLRPVIWQLSLTTKKGGIYFDPFPLIKNKKPNLSST